jgi:hypothetical protein
VFECFHNFVAMLGRDTGDVQSKAWFTKTMAGDFDKPDGQRFHRSNAL